MGWLGLIGSLISTVLSSFIAIGRENYSRQENYKYNEMAADNQDARTRALYNDISSPVAQRQQIEKAGLSPSLFYSGGVAGTGGMTGATGGGGGNLTPTVYGVSASEMAQIENTNADTQLKKAEAEKANKEARGIELNNAYQEIINTLQKMEYDFDWSYIWHDETGRKESLLDIAAKSNTFEDFEQNIRNALDRIDHESETYKTWQNYIQTNHGTNKLHQIYLNQQRFETQVADLSNVEENSKFQKSLVKAMSATNDEGKTFADWNAKAAISYLKANVQTSDLNETQKKSWNNIIQKLENKNSDMKDILIVLGMIFNNAMTNYKMPTINTGNRIYVNE